MAKKEKLLDKKVDRRLLSHVPDTEKTRANRDRRGLKNSLIHEGGLKTLMNVQRKGIRYNINYKVKATCYRRNGEKMSFECRGVDISQTGMLLKLEASQKREIEALENSVYNVLKFYIEPGSMPEGNEMHVKITSKIVRVVKDEDGGCQCGVRFTEELGKYSKRKRERYIVLSALTALFCIVFFIIFMRVESFIYFKFNTWLYLYSILAAIFLLSRYWFGMLYREKPIDNNFTPGVSIIIPCFNEEKWIDRTILSCLDQHYPLEQLEVIVVDDCSTDKSVEKIQQTLDVIKERGMRYEASSRVKCYVQEVNKGKRDALARGCAEAKHELVVFVDSDSFLDPYAIYHLVQPFKDPKIGGVSGRTDVANTYTNTLTKMQSVRYFIAFRIMKACEAYFDAVTCLSGPLSCYRKSIVREHQEEWLNQKFLGQRATFGDDRSMTNFILQKHRTSYQDSAVCYTIVPSEYKLFLKQQMRWKRSWIRESMIAASYIWKKEPFMAVLFYIGLIVPIAAPVIVVYNLLYVPLIQGIVPVTFLVGILMMASLMSAMQLYLRKSSTWIFGMLFCFFYEAVLLWQMPIAWVTFWKSTWGTRMTPEDVAEQKRKEHKFEKKPHTTKKYEKENNVTENN